MTTEKTPKLSTWLLWSPLKFATYTFLGLFTTTFLYIWFTGAILKIQNPSHILLATLLILVVSACTYFTLRKIPKFKMDQRSFVSIINAQTLIAAIAFSIITYFVFKYAQQILLHLMILEAKTSSGIIIIGILGTIFCLYLIGMLLCGVYAKCLRARELGIPTWKIICSMPLGLAALWIPGYILREANSKKTSLPVKCKWYNRIQDWALSSKTNTIAMFIFITLSTIFFMGLNSVLLTFCLTLIFGVWSLHVGEPKFLKNIGKTYSTVAVLINVIVLATLLTFHTLVPPTQPNIQMNISDTETTQINL